LTTKLKTTWNGNMKGNGTIKSDRLDTPIAIPNSLGGTGDGTDPKSLLIASAAACYSMTLVAILQNRKLPVSELTMESEVADFKETGFSIDHRLQVNLAPDATDEQIDAVKSAFQAADKACTIGNLLKKAGAQIQIDGSVSVAAPANA